MSQDQRPAARDREGAAAPRATVDADGILHELTTRQHLSPHRPLAQVVSDMTDRTGVCPVAAERALAWLGLDPSRPVGRLRRGELSQLARAVHRFWTRAIAAEERSGQPAQPRP